jgi:hypothetical protein
MLRSDTQGRLLARILADPAREHNLTELVEWTGSSMPTVSREVDRAERAGIVRSRKTGPTRLVRADEDHPLCSAVRQLILGTDGPPAVIAETFIGLAGAQAVVLFGSWAARDAGQPGRSPNDIDVLVIGDVDLDAMHDAADAAERQIACRCRQQLGPAAPGSTRRRASSARCAPDRCGPRRRPRPRAGRRPRTPPPPAGADTMTWPRGREDVQRLIDDGEIEIVEASSDVADRLLRNAEAHVRLASLGLHAVA